jgi:hypothetical protein
MKYLFLMAFAVTFIGSSCETPTGLTRSCPGSTVQSSRFLAQGSCGDTGVLTIALGTAGACTVTVDGSTTIGLPGMASFNDVASQTKYDITQGNLNFQNATNGTIGDNGGTACSSGAANASGVITLNCTITVCSTVGEDLEPTCAPGPTCMMALTPFTGDAAAYNIVPDASVSSAEAGAAKDATTP